MGIGVIKEKPAFAGFFFAGCGSRDWQQQKKRIKSLLLRIPNLNSTILALKASG
ncbi:hypothetical protein ACFQS6_02550 [Xanthomonas populi]